MYDPTQVRATNLYWSFRRGWLDGSAYRTPRPEFEQHEDAEMRAAYTRGLEEGRSAHVSAMRGAQALYGYQPSVLRESEVGS